VNAEDSPDYREIDRASEAGKALLRTAAARFGEAIVQAARIATRLFLLRSPWAPGLFFVGGETASPGVDEEGNPLPRLSLGGAGETPEEALVSCLGEGVERLAQFERTGDVCPEAPLCEVRDRVMPAFVPAIAQELALSSTPAAPLAWVSAHALAPNAEYHSGAAVLVPADWSLRRQAARVVLRPAASPSSGVAAGPDWDWAVSRALLELIERDAASLWWVGGRRARPVALDDPGLPELVRLIGALRRGVRARHTWLLDITTDIGIPVIAALSCAADGRGLACGLAARTSLAAAGRAAILELCQMELAILLARIKLAHRGEAGITALEARHLARATAVHAEECHLLHPLGPPANYPQPAEHSQLSAVAQALSRAGVPAALVDLTRDNTGIRAARALALHLQPMPSDLVTPRLQRVIAGSGGGERHTGGVALM
jgi:ribosomal protein S12 methylthiotransferase accessory factor